MLSLHIILWLFCTVEVLLRYHFYSFRAAQSGFWLNGTVIWIRMLPSVTLSTPLPVWTWIKTTPSLQDITSGWIAWLSLFVNAPGLSLGSFIYWSYFHRYTRYFKDDNGETFRTLFKVYGIRFDIMINGQVQQEQRQFFFSTTML